MRWIVRLLAIFGLVVIVLFGLTIVGLSRLHLAGRPPVPVAQASVLTLTVEGPFAEETPLGTGISAAFAGRATKLRDMVGALDRAAGDGRVKGLIVKIDASPGMAQAQELRAVIKRFRAAGKFAYAFADDYGEGAPGNGEYYLAAACDQIWLQPMGEVMITGIAFEQPFFKDALAKLDVEPEFVKRSEFKTAPEEFTERGYTPAAREMMESLANDLTMQLTAGLAEDRKLPADRVGAIMEQGPLVAAEALDAKLIDRIGYADEAVAAAKNTAGDGSRMVPLTDYDRQTDTQNPGKPNIALIYEVGEIGRVTGPIDPANGEDGLKGESAVVRGFANAMANPSIKSIVFRIDSPGGSVAGSESVRRMAVQAKTAGKKLVVSMGATAASGGYWIAADADKIVADPATLTGSIGVFSGKFVIAKGLGDLGVTVDRTADSKFAGMDSPFTPFSPDQTKRLNATIDSIYDGFVAHVAQGRKIPPATVAQSAKGRVWTGQQAKQLGLIDELGGLTDAIRVARELGGIGVDQPTVIKVYPEPVSPIEAVRDLLGGNIGASDAASRALEGLDGPAGAAVRALAPLFRASNNDMARMPDLGVMR